MFFEDLDRRTFLEAEAKDCYDDLGKRKSFTEKVIVSLFKVFSHEFLLSLVH